MPTLRKNYVFSFTIFNLVHKMKLKKVTPCLGADFEQVFACCGLYKGVDGHISLGTRRCFIPRTDWA